MLREQTACWLIMRRKVKPMQHMGPIALAQGVPVAMARSSVGGGSLTLPPSAADGLPVPETGLQCYPLIHRGGIISLSKPGNFRQGLLGSYSDSY